jgi:hypothetical protein
VISDPGKLTWRCDEGTEAAGQSAGVTDIGPLLRFNNNHINSSWAAAPTFMRRDVEIGTQTQVEALCSRAMRHPEVTCEHS